MSAKSITINNTLQAINDGIIEGKFNDEKTEFVFKNITYKGISGAKRNWTIVIKLIYQNDYVSIDEKMLTTPVMKMNDYKTEITIISSQDGGKIRDVVPTYILSGKNIGKKNETNVVTQAFRDALGLYNKQKKKSMEINDIMPPPMLLKSNNDEVITDEMFKLGITLQKKHNGVRLVSFINGEKINYYSRSGTLYSDQPLITKELESVMKEGIYFDGELYKHGKSLNWISGQARKDVNDNDLEYHIFDLFMLNDATPYIKRKELLQKIFNGKEFKFVKLVECYDVHSNDEIKEYVEKFIKDGYEGAVARKNWETYEYSYNNYHSSHILKIKLKFDAEFEIIGFLQGIKGKDVGAVIWICKTDKGEVFNVVPNMTYEMRYKTFTCLNKNDNFNKYIKGKMLTVEYSELSSKTGIPLQPKGVIIRTYEEGKEKDDFIKLCQNEILDK